MRSMYIDMALQEANNAYILNEVPVGAIIVYRNKVIASAHNLKRSTNCIMNHAEILAILEASNYIGDWRLSECEMYVTLEPCPMCAGAIAQARIKKIYIGTKSNIDNNADIINNILQNDKADHRVEIEYLNDRECSNILTRFFSNKR